MKIEDGAEFVGKVEELPLPATVPNTVETNLYEKMKVVEDMTTDPGPYGHFPIHVILNETEGDWIGSAGHWFGEVAFVLVREYAGHFTTKDDHPLEDFRRDFLRSYDKLCLINAADVTRYGGVK
jgi:hypothetical protein